MVKRETNSNERREYTVIKVRMKEGCTVKEERGRQCKTEYGEKEQKGKARGTC